jgi:hypothetical protein
MHARPAARKKSGPSVRTTRRGGKRAYLVELPEPDPVLGELLLGELLEPEDEPGVELEPEDDEPGEVVLLLDPPLDELPLAPLELEPDLLK